MKEGLSHVREAIVPDPLGEEVAIQLQEEEKEGLVFGRTGNPKENCGKNNRKGPQEKFLCPNRVLLGVLRKLMNLPPSTPPKSPRSDPDEPRVALSSGGGRRADLELDELFAEFEKN